MKTTYYHHKVPSINNIFTVCLLSDRKKVFSRGVAICSLLDSFSKAEGRRISNARALKAYYTKQNSENINKEHFKYEFVTRKFKTPELATEFMHNLTSEPNNIFLKKYANNCCICEISKNYPIYQTKRFFDFKSEFNPIPTKTEERILRISND